MTILWPPFVGWMVFCSLLFRILSRTRVNDEISEQATEAIQKSFDHYIQVAYDIANEEERDLIRQL